MKKLSLALSLAFGVTAFAEAQSSEISFQSVLSPSATNYIISSSNIGRWDEGTTSYFAPINPNEPAEIIQKFTFDQIVEQAFLNLSLTVFNFGNGRFGNGNVWVSGDGEQWEMILNASTPTEISNSERYSQNLPSEVLGGNSIWIRTRLFANNWNIMAQFLRYTVGNDTNAFDLRVEFEEVIEISEQNIEIGAEGGEGDFVVTSNADWNWSVDADWFTANEPATQNGNQLFSYIIEPNELVRPRSSTVTVRSSSGQVVRAINIRQAGATNLIGNNIGEPTPIGPSLTIDTRSQYKELKISRDSSTVVFRAFEGEDRDASALYAAPLSGGEATKISDFYMVRGWDFSDDGRSIVFFGSSEDVDLGERYEGLYLTPINGGEIIKLARVEREDASIGDFLVNESEVVFVATKIVNFETYSTDIYSVSLLGGEPRKLTNPIAGLENFGDIYNLKVNPSGSHIHFVAIRINDTFRGLYSVPIDGSENHRLISPNNIDVASTRLTYTPDGEGILVVMENAPAGRYRRLYKIPARGGGPILLSGSVTGYISYWQIANNGEKVIYRAEQTSTRDDLLSVSISGGTSANLSIGFGSVKSTLVTPDDSGVVFDTEDSSRIGYPRLGDLFYTPIPEGFFSEGNTKLNGNAKVTSPRFSNDETSLICKGVLDGSISSSNNADLQLLRFSLNGGQTIHLTEGLEAGRSVEDWQELSESSSIVYMADLASNRDGNLYIGSAFEGGIIKRISGPKLGGSRGVDCFQIAPDEKSIVYISDESIDGKYRLYNVRIGGDGIDDWLGEFFEDAEMSDPSLRFSLWGWDADPDDDGLRNLEELAFKTNPREVDVFNENNQIPIVIAIVDNQAELRYKERSDKERFGLEYIIEFSDDLINWTSDLTLDMILSTNSDDSTGFDMKTIRWPVNSKKFVRMRIALRP